MEVYRERARPLEACGVEHKGNTSTVWQRLRAVKALQIGLLNINLLQELIVATERTTSGHK
jgi:hypothetical protein